MKIGKLSPEDLERLIIKPITDTHVKRDEVIIRPKNGEDCSMVSFKNEYCVISTDPITGADRDAGYLAIHINCNDIAAAGCKPVAILLTALFPPNITEDEIREIVKGACDAADEVGIEIIGGHTEITDAVNKPVISGTVVGKTENLKFISSGGAEENDDIVMTKWAGVEGTSIIANDNYDYLINKIDTETLIRAKNLKTSISVLKESDIAKKYNATSLHDATEGGVLGAVYEIAECSDKGILIYEDKIPVLFETQKICEFYGINPLRLISSGTLIITTADGYALKNELILNGINAEVIGKITKEGKYIIKNGERKILKEPQSDELYRVKNG